MSALNSRFGAMQFVIFVRTVAEVYQNEIDMINKTK